MENAFVRATAQNGTLGTLRLEILKADATDVEWAGLKSFCANYWQRSVAMESRFVFVMDARSFGFDLNRLYDWGAFFKRISADTAKVVAWTHLILPERAKATASVVLAVLPPTRPIHIHTCPEEAARHEHELRA